MPARKKKKQSTPAATAAVSSSQEEKPYPALTVPSEARESPPKVPGIEVNSNTKANETPPMGANRQQLMPSKSSTGGQRGKLRSEWRHEGLGGAVAEADWTGIQNLSAKKILKRDPV